MLQPVGALLGERFTVEALLTSNTAAALYRARDLTTGEAAVVRILEVRSTEDSGAALLRHLDRMAPTLARVRHRNLGRYLAHGSTPEGVIFLASAAAPGEPAAARLARNESADAVGALRILRDGTAALAYLHAMGLVHGAVRPASLLVPATKTEPCTLLLDASCAREGDLVEDPGTLDGASPHPSQKPAAGSNGSAPLRREQDVTELGQIALAWLLGEKGLRARLPEPLLISGPGVNAHEVALLSRSLRAVFAPERSARVAEAAALRSLLLGPDPASTTDRGSGEVPAVRPEAATLDAAAGSPGSVRSVDSADDPLIGTTLEGRYRIEAQLGSGGMGVVYRARHLVLGTPLAVKLLLGAPRGEAYVQRFFREAQLASRIQHPNTVYISDFGLAPAGQPFLVMELVGGRTLRRLLVDEVLDPIRACRIAAQIAQGMQAIHDKDIVHRDLKPENVFVLSSGPGRDFVKIVDFGLAKELVVGGVSEGQSLAPASTPGEPSGECASDEATADTKHSARVVPQNTEPISPRPSDAGSPQQTATGALVGTPRYMSPEQAGAQAVDARADQYALYW